MIARDFALLSFRILIFLSLYKSSWKNSRRYISFDDMYDMDVDVGTILGRNFPNCVLKWKQPTLEPMKPKLKSRNLKKNIFRKNMKQVLLNRVLSYYKSNWIRLKVISKKHLKSIYLKMGLHVLSY